MEQGEIELLLELGQSYLLNQEYDQAIKKFSEALKINPHDPELYYNLGLAYEGANRPTDAILMYERTLQLDRTFSNAEIRLNKLQAKTVDLKAEMVSAEEVMVEPKKIKMSAKKEKSSARKKTKGTKKKTKVTKKKTKGTKKKTGEKK